MLKAGQRFRRFINTQGDVEPDIWRVVYANACRAHCASEKVVTATIGERSFEATSTRTMDIAPGSHVQLVSDDEVPRPTTRRDAKPHAVTPGAFVISNGTQFLRRIQINQAPGYRYDKVDDRGRATEYKSRKGAERSHDEFQSGVNGDDAFAVVEG